MDIDVKIKASIFLKASVKKAKEIWIEDQCKEYVK